AEALLAGDFFNSDMAWMDLQNNPLDIVIGPIETYEDKLMGLKASYEGFVMIRDKKETEKLARFKKYMNQLEHKLPVPRLYKKVKAAPRAPIGVFNTVYTSADANVAVKSIAFSLPNDERVRELKGARTVQQKNVILAKFNKIMVPISRRVLMDEFHSYVDGDAFFTNTLLHELAHPLGLNYVKGKNGVTVREALKENYSAIEEAKADVVGLFNVDFFVRRGVLSPELETKSYVTFLASIFRAVRFGATDAHARANMIEFNYLVKEKAVIFDQASGRYGANLAWMKTAIKKLAIDLLMIEGDGNYEKAGQWVKEMGIIPPEMQKLLNNLSDIPIDIEFKFDPVLFD
ncbi:MAG TPA: Zn-dependent hydrolase, partial [Bacteroidetes bacterium]|nr:Zn-dependent hydrolase [Bacteroidota bacterium]